MHGRGPGHQAGSDAQAGRCRRRCVRADSLQHSCDTVLVRWDAGPSCGPTIHRDGRASGGTRAEDGVACSQPPRSRGQAGRRRRQPASEEDPVLHAQGRHRHTQRSVDRRRQGRPRIPPPLPPWRSPPPSRGRPGRDRRPTGPLPAGRPDAHRERDKASMPRPTPAPASTWSSDPSPRHPATTWTPASTGPSSGSIPAGSTRRPPRR